MSMPARTLKPSRRKPWLRPPAPQNTSTTLPRGRAGARVVAGGGASAEARAYPCAPCVAWSTGGLFTLVLCPAAGVSEIPCVDAELAEARTARRTESTLHRRNGIATPISIRFPAPNPRLRIRWIALGGAPCKVFPAKDLHSLQMRGWGRPSPVKAGQEGRDPGAHHGRPWTLVTRPATP